MRCLVALVILSSTVAYADVHSDLMSDVQFKDERSETLQTNAGEVEIDYSGMGHEYRTKVFFENAQKASDMIPDYLKSKGVTSQNRCKKHSIKAYDVESSVLNQEGVYETVNWDDPSRNSLFGGRLLGLYDEPGSRSKTATIYVDIDLYTSDRTRIISHEMSHFWYDQYCLWTKDINSEKMAQEFEKFYKENFNDRKYRRLDSR